MKTRTAPTRAELLRAKRLLTRVEQGATLLRRKREALARALVPLARPAAEARRAISDAAGAAYRAELAALAMHGEGGVAATGSPPRAVEVELDSERVWGVPVPTRRALPAFDRDLESRDTAPGATGLALFEAANHFETLLRLLLDAVTRESHVRALGTALSRTARQLHTLEQRVAPELSARVAQVTAALDERAREDQTRLRTLRGRLVRR